MEADKLHEIHTCAILTFDDDGQLPATEKKQDEAGFEYLVLEPRSYWNPGEEIHVKFLEPEPGEYEGADFSKAKKDVEAIAREWEEFANIRFNFDNASDAPVRVRFFPGRGGYSALGTSCLKRGQLEETVSIGLSRDNDAFRNTVLHEFGHVLGCLHEHSSPMSNIEWNKEKVYQYYRFKHKWSRERVDKQILNRHEDLETDHSSFDNMSIMIYPLDHTITNMAEIPLHTKLSPRDKSFISQIYPLTIIPEEKGAYFSWHYKYWGRKDPKNRARVTFNPECTTVPPVAVGLSQFDIDCDQPLWLRTNAVDVTTKGFEIQTKTWKNSVLYSAGASWFKVDNPATSDFQVGTFDTSKYVSTNVATKPQKHTVKFKRSFTSLPEVVVWLQGFYMGLSARYKLAVSPSDITNGDFVLNIEPGPDTKLYQTMVTWIAYPKDKLGVFSGATHSKPMEVWHEQSDNRRGYTELVDLDERKEAQGCTADRFRVSTGINSFDFTADHNLRLHTEVEAQDGADDFTYESSFHIEVKTWNKTICSSATAAWLAVAKGE
ncbi:hypothetical protein F4805DRAFT_420896 [Annulohypoxylon moriforme]|nr:hypothetical protein F4805DRAFT_420896 [Annulohypoxylon moriforme]